MPDIRITSVSSSIVRIDGKSYPKRFQIEVINDNVYFNNIDDAVSLNFKVFDISFDDGTGRDDFDTPLAFINHLQELVFSNGGGDGLGVSIAPITTSKDVFLECSRGVNAKKILIIGTSIWDGQVTAELLGYMNDHVKSVGFHSIELHTQATMTSTQFIENLYPDASLNSVVSSALGIDGINTHLNIEVGINDLDYETTLFTIQEHGVPALAKLIQNLDILFNALPKATKTFWTGPTSENNSFNAVELWVKQQLAINYNCDYFDLYKATAGLRRIYHASNKTIAGYNDALHPKTFTLYRCWLEFLRYSVDPSLYSLITVNELANIQAKPAVVPNISPITGSYNAGVNNNGVPAINSTTSHYRFQPLDVSESAYYVIKFPENTGIIVPKIIFSMSDGSFYGGGDYILPPKKAGQEFHLVSIPVGAVTAYVTITTSGADFLAEYNANNECTYFRTFFPRDTYRPPLSDIMVGLPNVFGY